MTIACPQCKHPLTLPHPAPERMPCPHCRAVIKFSPAKSAAVKVPAATSAAVSTAKMVAGYELQRELARGGLGVVYLAFHPHMKHYRAIKRPQARPDLDNELVLGRFRRETEALGTLESKHIIRAYDAGADADGPYMVTEYLDGESLSSLLSRHRQLPVSEACELMRQVALGLQSAHESGMVHRDIKPSNLMLTRATAGTARTVVIDWGLVKRSGETDAPANRLTKIHTQLGTPDYISPEQIRDAHSVDIRADIYSLGATLYFLLAGQPPFHGRSDEQKLLAQTREEFPSLEPARPDVPPNLINILKKMVKKNPAERYQTPGEVAAALQPFACAEPHRMLALLAPVALEQKTASDTARILDDKTQLAPPPSAPIAPQPQGQSLVVWLAVGAGLLIVLSACILISVIGIGMMMKKDGDPIAKGKEGGNKDQAKDSAKADSPRELINEEFRKGFGIPDGWKGDAFRIIALDGRNWLEVSRPDGVYFAKLPPVTISGDFYIEGAYSMVVTNNSNYAITVILENSKANAPLSVSIFSRGQVAFGDDMRTALPTFKPNLPASFRLTRKGKLLRVAISGEEVATKEIPQVIEYDTLSIAMTPYFSSKLFNLKVVALPP